MIISGILFKIDPNSATSGTIIVFYLTLFIILFSFFTFLGYFLRIRILKAEFFKTYLKVSSRQAALISFAIIGLLILSASSVLNWWDGILLVFAILLLELYFKGNKT